MLTGTLIILGFFFLHFWGSVFMQTFFLHRYASHGMFQLSRGWERFFYLMTYLFQGSSYLVPSAYAWLHRAHHAYSDTDLDPHTPHRIRPARIGGVALVGRHHRHEALGPRP